MILDFFSNFAEELNTFSEKNRNEEEKEEYQLGLCRNHSMPAVGMGLVTLERVVSEHGRAALYIGRRAAQGSAHVW